VIADEFPSGRWRARWIWSGAPALSLSPSAQPIIDRQAGRGHALFRRTFTIDAVPDHAWARCTADSRYALWVNGTEVGRGPVRGNPQRLHYDAFDLAAHLVPGDNVIAVHGRHYGEATPWWIPSPATFGLGGGALVFEAALGDAHDPLTPWITSDESWRSCEPPAWDEHRGGGIGDMAVEVVDARELPARWQMLGFGDETWTPAHVLATNFVGFVGDPHPPTHPYGPLLPRPIPQLTGATRTAGVRSTRLVGPPTELLDDPIAHYNAAEQRAESSATTLAAHNDGTDGAILTFAGRADGETLVVILDFGEQVAGHVGIVIDAPAGTRIDAKAAEALDANGRLEALQQRNGFRYTARGHDDAFETFDTIGLRYLGLAIRAEGPVTLHAVTVRERLFARDTVTSRPTDHEPHPRPLDDLPFFECSDPELNDIWRIGRRTVDLCSQDAYLDCPSREQRAWTGDSVVHQMVDLTTNLDWSLARWNVELGASPRRDGMLPMVAGGDMEHADNTFIPDWALHWMHALHNVWQYTGDRAFVASMLPVAERMLRWFEAFQDRDGLLDDVSGWVIIDWAAVHGRGKSAALNALWARALAELATIAEAFDDRGRAAWALERRHEVARGFEQFWDPGRARYIDNIVAGVPGRATSQHGNAAALVAGLVPTGRHDELLASITDPSRLEHAAWLMPGMEATLDGPGDMYAGFGYLVMGPPEPWWDVEEKIVAAQPFFRYVVHDAVVAAGRADLIPALCRDWRRLTGRSATTWSEVWYGGSYCHAWCSTPTRDLVQRTLGITPATPGFTTARIAPSLGDLEWARGAVPTPHGLIRIEVTRSQITFDSPVPTIVEKTPTADAIYEPQHFGAGRALFFEL
jgi:alpha-L-rhamnosidase